MIISAASWAASYTTKEDMDAWLDKLLQQPHVAEPHLPEKKPGPLPPEEKKDPVPAPAPPVDTQRQDEIQRIARDSLRQYDERLRDAPSSGMPMLTESDIVAACKAMDSWMNTNRADLDTVMAFLWSHHDEWESAGITHELDLFLHETEKALGPLISFAGHATGKLPSDVHGLEVKLRDAMAKPIIALKCAKATNVSGALKGYRGAGTGLIRDIMHLAEKHADSGDAHAAEVILALKRLLDAAGNKS